MLATEVGGEGRNSTRTPGAPTKTSAYGNDWAMTSQRAVDAGIRLAQTQLPAALMHDI